MAFIDESIDVAVDIRTAYDQWTQFEEFPRFMSAVKRVEQRDDRHLHWVLEIAGQERSWDAEIVEQIPDERIEWRSVTGGGWSGPDGPQNSGVVRFEKLDAGHTRITLQIGYEPSGRAEQLADTGGLVSRQARADLQRFKEFIEARGAATGAWRREIDPREGGRHGDIGTDLAEQTAAAGRQAQEHAEARYAEREAMFPEHQGSAGKAGGQGSGSESDLPSTQGTPPTLEEVATKDTVGGQVIGEQRDPDAIAGPDAGRSGLEQLMQDVDSADEDEGTGDERLAG